MERSEFYNESELKTAAIEDYKLNIRDVKVEERDEINDETKNEIGLIDAEHIKCEIEIGETVLYDGNVEVNRDFCEKCVKREIENTEETIRNNKCSHDFYETSESRAFKCEENETLKCEGSVNFKWEDRGDFKHEESGSFKCEESGTITCDESDTFECEETDNFNCEDTEDEAYHKSIQEQENQNLAEDNKCIILFVIKNGEQDELPTMPTSQSKVLRSRRISFEQEYSESESDASSSSSLLEMEVTEDERSKTYRRKIQAKRMSEYRKRKRDKI